MEVLTKDDLSAIVESLDQVSNRLSIITGQPELVIWGTDELCDNLNVSSKTVQRWRDAGLIRYSKIGNSIFYKLSDVLAMLDRHSVDPII